MESRFLKKVNVLKIIIFLTSIACPFGVLFFLYISFEPHRSLPFDAKILFFPALILFYFGYTRLHNYIVAYGIISISRRTVHIKPLWGFFDNKGTTVCNTDDIILLHIYGSGKRRSIGFGRSGMVYELRGVLKTGKQVTLCWDKRIQVIENYTNKLASFLNMKVISNCS